MLDSQQVPSEGLHPLEGVEQSTGPLSRASRHGARMLQRIGWLRPSADERRLLVVEGAVVLATVALIGAVVFLLLR